MACSEVPRFELAAFFRNRATTERNGNPGGIPYIYNRSQLTDLQATHGGSHPTHRLPDMIHSPQHHDINLPGYWQALRVLPFWGCRRPMISRSQFQILQQNSAGNVILQGVVIVVIDDISALWKFDQGQQRNVASLDTAIAFARLVLLHLPSSIFYYRFLVVVFSDWRGHKNVRPVAGTSITCNVYSRSF
jgi:hypothetical protein